MEAALYGEGGFFTSGHGAGRAGRDFVTSPEVGSLFGACVAHAIDGYWRALGEPDPFLVVEAGAGNGRLARDVLRAEPACAPALRYVLVERSPALRAQQRERLALEPADEAIGPFVRGAGEDRALPAAGAGPVFAALDDLPAIEADGALVIANELLDNLPFGIAEFDGDRWNEVRIALAPSLPNLRDFSGSETENSRKFGEDAEGFAEVVVPMLDASPIRAAIEVPAGTRVPIPRGLTSWFAQCDEVLRRGYVVVIDYMVDAAELPGRPWLRTYREHGFGESPEESPGTLDITADVVFEQLVAAAPFALATDTTQADWLRTLGIDALVEEGRRAWDEGAHRGDFTAIAGRSRVHEAAALTDPAGLGAHRVVCFAKGV
jgi:SAM-dependent MidA family methyltransferase